MDFIATDSTQALHGIHCNSFEDLEIYSRAPMHRLLLSGTKEKPKELLARLTNNMKSLKIARTQWRQADTQAGR